MKKLLKDESRIYRQPPAEVERRILLAARIAARMSRHTAPQHRFNWFVAAGAAAVLAVGSIMLIPAARDTRQVEGRRIALQTSAAGHDSTADPLAAVSDWSGIDQESYNLSCQLNSERNELSDLTNDLYII